MTFQDGFQFQDVLGISMTVGTHPVSYGVFTPEQDTDKTTTRQMLNLCIPMMPFTPGPTHQV